MNDWNVSAKTARLWELSAIMIYMDHYAQIVHNRFVFMLRLLQKQTLCKCKILTVQNKDM